MSTRSVGPPPPRRARPRPGLPPWAFGLVIALGAVLLIVAAFLIGRFTAAAPKVAQLHDQGARPEIEVQPDAAATTDPIEGPAPFPQETTQTPIFPSAPPDDLSEAAPSQNALPMATDGQKAAVAAYFTQMDVIGEAAKSTQNPETLARSVVDQTMSGNTSGIDELLLAQRALHSRMAEVQAPASCQEHHTRSLRAIGRAISLLERTRGALASQDVTSLASLGPEGQAIEQEAKAIDALAAEIRRAVGLPAIP